MHSAVATKTLAAVLAAGFALLLHVPSMVNRSASAALLLIVLDTITGYVCAAFDSNWSSHMMRIKLVAKSSQYVLLLGCSACAGILAGDWSFVVAGWWAIAAIEAHSILENLIKWQKWGVDLGPAAPLLSRLSGFFAAGQIRTNLPTNSISNPNSVENSPTINSPNLDKENQE